MFAKKPFVRIEYLNINGISYRLVVNYRFSVKTGNICPVCNNNIRAAQVVCATHKKRYEQTVFSLLSAKEEEELMPLIIREYQARQTFCVYCAAKQIFL